MDTPAGPTPAASLAATLVAELADRGLTLATAESLTGGGVGALVTSVSGASAVYAGGVIAYATEVKVALLGVPADLVAEQGVISDACAAAMAAGARRLFGTDLALATTGVAGPDPQEGHPAGRVHVAVADERGTEARTLLVPGDRAAVRAATAVEALRLLHSRLGGSPGGSPGGTAREVGDLG